MHIAFKFKYIHNNGLFTRLCKRVSELSPLSIHYYKDGDVFYIESSGMQQELEDLAELISSTIPQSLFLHESTIEEIDVLSQKKTSDEKALYYEVPYCIECQNEIIKTLNPFNQCDVCGFSEQSLNVNDVNTDFTHLAENLIESKELELITYNGIRRFSLLSTKEKENSSILICDPSNISKLFLLTQGELELLMMVEKPSVRLKPKLIFHHENELQKPFYNIFFADDKITLALTTALSKKGIVAIYCDKDPALRVACALGENVIVKSARDMLPWKYPFISKTPISCNFDEYHAYADKDGLTLSNTLVSTNKKSVEFISNDKLTENKDKISFEPGHGALRSVILEQGLDNKSLCCIYFSKEHPSNICSYSSKIGYLPMVSFTNGLLTNPKTILNAIETMDEAGARLISNFKNAYPDLYDELLDTNMHYDENASMITKLWAMAAHVIGITSIGSYKVASEYLEATALEFHGKSGPRIDYKIINADDGYQLDPRLAIRSAMSFKLAGVDEYLVSFGFIDSLADFIAQQAEFADGNINIDGVVLSGSLFENHQLLMRTYNAITPNYKVYRNKRLSIDGANVAAGAVTLGNE